MGQALADRGFWEKRVEELQEGLDSQLGRWFAMGLRGEYELEGAGESKPQITLREAALLEDTIELYEALLGRKGWEKRPSGGKGALLPPPSEEEIERSIQKLGREPTIAMVSYHTNPLYAIRERVREEEGIEIDVYDQGGQGTYQERVAYEMAEGFNVEVLTFTLKRSYLTKERYFNIHPRAPVIPIPYSGPYVVDETGLVRKEDICFIIDALVDRTVEYLHREGIRVDIFSGHYATGVAAARRLHERYRKGTTPYSATTHSLGWERFIHTYYQYSPSELIRFNFSPRLREEKEAYLGADLVVTVSPTEVQSITNPHLYGVRSEKVVSIPGGVDTELFRPYHPQRDEERVGVLRDRYGIAPDDRVILVIGRLWDYKRKGVDTAIEVAAIVERRVKESLKFAFVGLPPRDHPQKEWRVAREEIETLVDERGIDRHTVLVEMVLHEEVPAWLQLVARSRGVVLALPRTEPWGLMNLEAMAVGNVVVTIDRGGPPHYIAHMDSGILVDRNDIDQIADRVMEVLCGEELAHRIRKKAHLVASRDFSWRGVTRRFLWAHLQIIGRQGCARCS